MKKAMGRKKGAPPSELSRDMYGFIVRPQHLLKYREFESIYKVEEEERCGRWDNFLISRGVEATTVDNAGTVDGNVDPVEVKVNVEPTKPRVVQRWGELRSSLTALEQGLGNRVKLRSKDSNEDAGPGSKDAGPDSEDAGPDGKDAGPDSADAGPDGKDADQPGTTTESSDGDDSEDEFYDLDKADSTSEPSPQGKTPTTSKEDADGGPWKEELQFLVRGGVPMALRGQLWQIFVATKARRIEGHYDALLAQLNASEKWTSQIEKDLPRTFPNHPALDEDGRNALRRLLTAYARHNPVVGYCQAMNFFAGLLLLLMPEENAFWTLIGIMDDYFEGYYSERLVEAQVDQCVFEELARQHFPKLLSRLDAIGVQVPTVCGPWFLSIFVNILPWETVLRVWDVMLFEGNRSMLFRTALALMDLHAPAVMAANDAGDTIHLMQSVAGSTFDSSQLVLTACVGFPNIDEQQLEALRAKHRPTVLATLDRREQELLLWRNSQGVLKYKAKAANGAAIEDEESPVEDEEMEDDDSSDLQDQVVWLKNEITLALEEKKRAVQRAEELDVALMEIVKEDNRRELSAKVEKLELEVASLQQMLSDKMEQERAMVQVLLRVEQETKLAEDARRFAEKDAEIHREAAILAQEKYEEAAEKLAAMEKRAVMAESILEATIQYEAGQPGSNGGRRQSKDEEPSRWWSLRSPRDSVAGKPKATTPSDAGEGKQGLFSRIRGSKVKAETPPTSPPSSNGTAHHGPESPQQGNGEVHESIDQLEL